MIGDVTEYIQWIERLGAMGILAVLLWWLGKHMLVPIRDSHTTTLERINSHLDVVDRSLETISNAVKETSAGHEHLRDAVDEVKQDVAAIKDGLKEWAVEYRKDHNERGER